MKYFKNLKNVIILTCTKFNDMNILINRVLQVLKENKEINRLDCAFVHARNKK